MIEQVTQRVGTGSDWPPVLEAPSMGKAHPYLLGANPPAGTRAKGKRVRHIRQHGRPGPLRPLPLVGGSMGESEGEFSSGSEKTGFRSVTRRPQESGREIAKEIAVRRREKAALTKVAYSFGSNSSVFEASLSRFPSMPPNSCYSLFLFIIELL